MKFAFLVITILINFFNHSLIKSEEKIDSANNKIENIARKEAISEEKTEIKKIHIVKSGDTITSISKLYSINKDLIIKLKTLLSPKLLKIPQNNQI
jgi:LysM repeat protein